MSTIGTGIAAAVANTGQSARTQATTQSGREAQRADHAQQTDKFTVSQTQDAGATRDTDQDMPDGQSPGYENLYGDEQADAQASSANEQIHDADAPAVSRTTIPLQPSYAPGSNDHPLFHAIDLKA